MEDVSVSPADSSVAHIDVDLGSIGADGRVIAFITMRFAASVSDESVRSLARGQDVRIRGTLNAISLVESRFVAREPTKWANFVNVTVSADRN